VGTMSRYARCDYCGRLFPPQRVVLFWVHVYTLGNGEDEVVTTGIYCGEPCAEWSDSRAGASR
jgi:hypothetical protein